MYALDTARRITWQDTVGISGGIPSTYTKYGSTIQASTYGNGSSDASAAINAALAAASTSQYVLLSAGTFRLNSDLTIPSGRVLRGAGSSQTPGVWSNQTILNSYAAWHAVQIGDYPSTPVDTNVSGSPAKGATTLTVASVSTPALSVGDLIVIDQTDDGTEVVNVDESSRDSGTRCLSQITQIAQINTLTLTIDPPLHHAYAAARTPQVWKLTQGGSLTTGAGIEDLQLIRVSPTTNDGYSNIKMICASGCWVKNVESKLTQWWHVDLDRCFRCHIEHNYFNDGYGHATGGRVYGVVCGYFSSCNHLIVNNIFRRCRHSMVVKQGASGNVFSYNYSYQSYQGDGWLAADMNAHGAHSCMNLFEGNICDKIYADFTHGSSSYNTFFRNHSIRQTSEPSQTSSLRAVDIEQNQYYYNLLGNVLGLTGQTWTAYEDPGTRTSSGRYAYCFGYFSDGGTTTADAQSKATVLRHANYDYANSSIVYNGADDQTLPTSLLYAAKPSFLAGLAWPPIDITNPGGTTNAAKYRSENGSDPYGAPVGTPVLSVR